MNSDELPPMRSIKPASASDLACERIENRINELTEQVVRYIDQIAELRLILAASQGEGVPRNRGKRKIN